MEKQEKVKCPICLGRGEVIPSSCCGPPTIICPLCLGAKEVSPEMAQSTQMRENKDF